MRASTCNDGLRRQAVGGERMDGEVFFSGLIFGVSVGVVLGYCLPHRLPPREEQQPEIERLVEHFNELLRHIEWEKKRNRGYQKHARLSGTSGRRTPSPLGI